MAEEMDVILHEVAEEASVNEELAETECKLLDEITNANHQLKIIRQMGKLTELRNNSKRIYLNIIKLCDTLCQREIMIQRESRELENVSTILLMF